MNNDSPKTSSTAGHRERMRKRFLGGDTDALSDKAMLELLLTYSIPRRDVKPLAQLLVERFGNIAGVLAADPADLKKVSGIKNGSVVLLKLVDHLRAAGWDSKNEAPTRENSSERAEAEAQPVLFLENSPSPDLQKKVSAPSQQNRRSTPPKLQVSNGYSLDAAQNARILTYISEHPTVRSFARRDLMEGTGLSDGQIEALVSIGAAIGLVVPRTQVLTPVGALVAKHDMFLDSVVTLEFCHFLGAGNPRNLIWHMIFNDLLATQKPTDQAGWSAWVRQKLAGKYSERSLVKHVAHEVRFLLDAYTVRNFKKLGLLAETPDKTLALRRYTTLQPLTLAAMIYWQSEDYHARLVAFPDLYSRPGSPGRVFGIDEASLRPMVENLHQKGWIRFEVRHGLDQVRLVDGLTPLEFLSAAYEHREPVPQTPPEAEHFLL